MSATEKQIGGDHYKAGIQHVEFVEANNIPYLEAQVMKYICRHDKKNGVEDILKAIHYCEFILQFRYNTTQSEQEKKQ